MELKSFQFREGQGWSIDQFPKLDSSSSLILVFSAAKYLTQSQAIETLVRNYPLATIVGCISAGEIFGSHVCEESLSVAVIQFKKTQIKLATLANEEYQNAYHSGITIAQYLDQKDLAGIFVLSNGIKINGSQLVEGLNSLNKKNILVSGGLAGGSEHFKLTWAIVNGKIKYFPLVAIGFYGTAIRLGHGAQNGWNIFGPEKKITKSLNNILFELDGKPALALYKAYLREKSQFLPQSALPFPIAIRKNIQDTRYLMRTIIDVNEAEQSLTLASDIPNGYLAQFLKGNGNRLMRNVSKAVTHATQHLQLSSQNKQPILSIAISGVSRKLLFGKKIAEEIDLMLEHLPEKTQQIGFYAYGELTHYQGRCDLQNQTMSLTTIYEEENDFTWELKASSLTTD